MNEVEFESAPTTPRPRTTTVVGLLVLAAGFFSYLGTYAVANAMVAAEVIKPWPRDHDPRLRWFAIGFVVLISLFCAIAAAARQLSTRHLRQIEAMEQETE